MEKRRLSPLAKYGRVFGFGLIALVLFLIVGWLATYGICTLDIFPKVCRYEHLYLIVSILVTVIILSKIGGGYYNRAVRIVNRGVWRQPGQLNQAFGFTMQLVTRVATDEPESGGLITGLDRFKREGWWVPIPMNSGTTVWVDQYTFWQWLEQVEALRANGVNYPTSRNQWEKKIGKPLWLAYCRILEEVGVLPSTTGDPRGKRYVGAIPWSVVEQYAKMRPLTKK